MRDADIVSRGFRGRRRDPYADPRRVPPGQFVTGDFPVLSAGATPRTPLDRWTFSIENGGVLRTWTWEEFRALPSEPITADIHCVTRWSKLDELRFRNPDPERMDYRVLSRGARPGGRRRGVL